MLISRFSKMSVIALGLATLVGCASKERATVGFSYVVEPAKGLPPGVDTVAILPAKVGPTTDEKWSDMSVTILQSLISESRGKFGTQVNVTERRDTKPIFDEADLAAAGMSDRRGGADAQLAGADAYVLSNINVKVETHTGKQRTLSGLDLSGLTSESGWRGPYSRGTSHTRGGSADIRTEEVETVTRNMIVQTEFKLVDAKTGKVWEHFSPRTYRSTDRTKASIIFGSSRTEAELTPRDSIVATLVERGAREFVSQLMPVRVDVEAEIESSNSPNSIRGVQLLRAEDFNEARDAFKAALAENPNDHRSAYGAGVAAEAVGDLNQALSFYKNAVALQGNPEYIEARDRVKIYAGRVRKG
jgi:hypothetical protein